MIVFHDPRCIEYSQPGHPERPERITRTAPLLKERHPDWQWQTAVAADKAQLLRAHSHEHVQRVRTAAANFDADTPAYANIYDHAARAAGAAIAVAKLALEGQRAFSLTRPPGHHATRDRAMGFCYFSHIAIAALNALENGANRVAIWDFDAHHGNGTEDIVARDDRIVFASIHQFPGYPGTGTRSFDNIYNSPVPPYAPRNQHMRAMRDALEQLLAGKPELLLVSAGFDAFSGDPITQMSLAVEDFATLGRWLREIDIPTGAILEGGYSDELPVLIDAFLSSWENS